MTLVDEALLKIVDIGTIDAMKWLHQATKEKAAKVCEELAGGDMWIQGIAENIRSME